MLLKQVIGHRVNITSSVSFCSPISCQTRTRRILSMKRWKVKVKVLYWWTTTYINNLLTLSLKHMTGLFNQSKEMMKLTQIVSSKNLKSTYTSGYGATITRSWLFRDRSRSFNNIGSSSKLAYEKILTIKFDQPLLFL